MKIPNPNDPDGYRKAHNMSVYNFSNTNGKGTKRSS